MRKFAIERTDGKIDYILADRFTIDNGRIVYFVQDEHEYLERTYYVLSNIVKIADLGEVKEDEESEDPERHKNDNDDLISRSKLLSFLRNHWSSNVIEVIESFEKAEFLD